jgi:hypothetical protein
LGHRYSGKTEGVRWARVTEYQNRKVLHFHALIGGIPQGISCSRYRGEWKKVSDMAGHSVMRPIESHDGAILYICKNIPKDGDIVLGGEWEGRRSK